jgi:hypothetical protein
VEEMEEVSGGDGGRDGGSDECCESRVGLMIVMLLNLTHYLCFIVCWRYSMTDMYYRDDILCEVCA